MSFQMTLMIISMVATVSSDVRSVKRCGWFYGKYACFSQPMCIEKSICSSFPPNPFCGSSLPACVESAKPKVELPLPTLPPLIRTTLPYRGFRMGSPMIYLPPPPKQGASPTRLPKIINAPVASIMLKEKQQLKLICSVDTGGDPRTRIEWIRKRDNAIVGRGETLILNNINQTDAGKYYCKAKNPRKLVAAMAQTDVNVECSPKSSDGVGHTIMTANPGETVTILCETNCKPEPDFFWYRDNAVESPLKTCESDITKEDKTEIIQKDGTRRRGSVCDLMVTVGKTAARFTCLKTNNIGKEKQTYEIKPRAINPPTSSTSNLLAAPSHKLNKDGIFKAIGCFAKCDECVSNFPELLFRDTGQTEDREDSLEDYTSQFVYRCANESRSRGFEYFGITNYDQCYSGDQTVKTYDRFGKSNTCINGKLKLCSSDDNMCLGQCSSIYVYKFFESKSNQNVPRKKRTGDEDRLNMFKASRKRPRPCPPIKKFLEKAIISNKFGDNDINLSFVNKQRLIRKSGRKRFSNFRL